MYLFEEEEGWGRVGSCGVVWGRESQWSQESQ
jgi:hypothetical protein